MKTVLDKNTREELVARAAKLNAGSQPQWGKMNAWQMLNHCVLCEEMYQGNKEYKRVFMGRLFGRMALRKLLKDEMPLQRNAPTSPHFKIKQSNGDVEAEKKRWIGLLNAYEHFSKDNFVHWFFGPMTREEVGLFAYKHADHHLRQFNV